MVCSLQTEVAQSDQQKQLRATKSARSGPGKGGTSETVFVAAGIAQISWTSVAREAVRLGADTNVVPFMLLRYPGMKGGPLAIAGRGGAITFETIGEHSFSLAQAVRHASPSHGYEPLLSQFLGPILVPALEAGITIVGNFGAANPQAAARVVADLARSHGLSPRALP